MFMITISAFNWIFQEKWFEIQGNEVLAKDHMFCMYYITLFMPTNILFSWERDSDLKQFVKTLWLYPWKLQLEIVWRRLLRTWKAVFPLAVLIKVWRCCAPRHPHPIYDAFVMFLSFERERKHAAFVILGFPWASCKIRKAFYCPYSSKTTTMKFFCWVKKGKIRMPRGLGSTGRLYATRVKGGGTRCRKQGIVKHKIRSYNKHAQSFTIFSAALT